MLVLSMDSCLIVFGTLVFVVLVEGEGVARELEGSGGVTVFDSGFESFVEPSAKLY